MSNIKICRGCETGSDYYSDHDHSGDPPGFVRDKNGGLKEWPCGYCGVTLSAERVPQAASHAGGACCKQADAKPDPRRVLRRITIVVYVNGDVEMHAEATPS